MKNKMVIIYILLAVIISASSIFLFTRSKNNISPVVQTLDPLNISYVVGGQSFNLVNGKAELAIENSSFKNTLYMFGAPVYGDLDKDGDKDAAVLLVNNSGGSGTFYYAALAINNNGTYAATGTMLLGDRIAPQTVEIQEGHALYNFAIRKGTDPMSTPPSIGKSVWVYYNAKDNTIGEWVKDFEGETDNKTLINSITTTDKYIHPVKWPPVPTVVDIPFTCSTALVNGYCITQTREGAAGSTYTDYIYTREFGHRTAKLEFTIQSVQCFNYDQPERDICLKTQLNYNLLSVINALFKSLLK